MEEREFIYDEKRSCKKCLLFTKCSFSIFHIVSLCACFINIENKIIGYYAITLLAIFISICNRIRYEYAYIKNYGRRFPSFYVFIAWKKEQQMPRFTYSLECIESLAHIVFFIQSWSFSINLFEKKELILYRFSCLFLHLYTILILFMWCCACIFLCSVDISRRLLIINAIRTDVRIDILVDVDDQKECCICMDKNTKEWIETPCVHSFHRECLNGWTQMNRTCPICRSSL